MATIEFIQKRIEGKEKEIAKLTKKMERIIKAQESNWEVNPYYYNENDLKWTGRDLEKAQKALEEYKAQMISETEKANSRNIPAIIEFLDMWKERVTEYYHEQFDEYMVAREEWYKVNKEYCDWSNSEGWKVRRENPEEYKRIEKEYKDKRTAYQSRWNFIFDFVEASTFNEEKFQKMLKRDADAKYDFIIERTNDIVGEITDATNLHIGAKGDLNGFIIGTKGTAKVQTIGAGGYNIQCYHFRTLINKVNK
jgi:hypothetical protein